MKISNSKKQLARIISENGGWRDGEFAAQDSDGSVEGYGVKPKWDSRYKYWWREALGGWFSVNKINNHHQTALSREEYFHLYPAQDADGWIEFDGTERPSGYFNKMIDVKLQNGRVLTDSSGRFEWDTDGASRIIAYRPHKPEQAQPQSPVEMAFDIIKQGVEIETKPTIEQLAAEYRNRKDYADRKQAEADAAKAGAEAKLAELVSAGKSLNLVISLEEKEPELVITDWLDLQVGDEIKALNVINVERLNGAVGVVEMIKESAPHGPLLVNFPQQGEWWVKEWKFVRRP